MKRFILLCCIILVSCAPSVNKVDKGYFVSSAKGAFLVIGSSESITAWQPVEACAYQETAFGSDRAVKCPVPVAVTVFTEGEITVFETSESGLPLSLPN